VQQTIGESLQSIVLCLLADAPRQGISAPYPNGTLIMTKIGNFMVDSGVKRVFMVSAQTPGSRNQRGQGPDGSSAVRAGIGHLDAVRPPD
jgi:hypothetical protein